MESESNQPRVNHTPDEQPPPVEPPAPRKRFRVEKVEERIAPKKKGGDDSSATFSSVVSIY